MGRGHWGGGESALQTVCCWGGVDFEIKIWQGGGRRRNDGFTKKLPSARPPPQLINNDRPLKLILSVFGKKNCATNFVPHDCQNCNVKNVDRYLLSWQIGIKRTGSFICFVCPSMFQLSRVTRNHWLSLDDVYSHKLCRGETCVYMIYKERVSPYHVTRVWLQIM